MINKSNTDLASPVELEIVRPNLGNCSFTSKSVDVLAYDTCGMSFTPVNIARGEVVALLYAPTTPVGSGVSML